MEIRGILDVDMVCLTEIFKFLTPLDLCSTRQSCTHLRNSVDDYSRSLYFSREQCLDLREENIRNVKRILINFGKFVRCLKVGEKTIKPKLLLDAVDTNCRGVLKGLSLYNLRFSDTEIFGEFFNNLEILEFIKCYGYRKGFETILLGHQMPNLATLNVKYSEIDQEILIEFFMRPRNIKKLGCNDMDDGILSLIVKNATEMEELDIVPRHDGNLMLVAQFSKLKLLEVNCYNCDQRSIIALIKELSANNELEVLGLRYVEFNKNISDELSNLRNLKDIRLEGVHFAVNDNESIELLAQKLPKLESLKLKYCRDVPHLNILALACKSDTLRTIYVRLSVPEVNKFIERMVKDFSDGKVHNCFVSGKTLCIYLHEEIFIEMAELLTQDHLQSIEKYGNIKIRPANRDAFFNPSLM